MKPRILLVDDEANLMMAMRRQYHDAYDIEAALGAAHGLDVLAKRGPFAVVVSDYSMPGASGIDFLREARVLAPHTVRVMLTGGADLSVAAEAVNEGEIFRFLFKPCAPALFCKAVDAAVRQHHLLIAERELIESTLTGAVKALTDVMSLTNPAAFSRGTRIRTLARQMAVQLGLEDPWEIEIAAMLSQVGCITVPAEALDRLTNGGPISAEEERALVNHPAVGRSLIANIPRLERIADAIGLQGWTPENQAVDTITTDDWAHVAARILTVALEYDELAAAGAAPEIALKQLRERNAGRDIATVDALECAVDALPGYTMRRVAVRELAVGMVIGEQVATTQGVVMFPEGYEVTPASVARLDGWRARLDLGRTIRVFVPTDVPSELASPPEFVATGGA